MDASLTLHRLQKGCGTVPVQRIAGLVYDSVMQIAVTIADETVDELDKFVPSKFRSRAEVVRHAVTQWLASERAAEIDRRYIQAYEQAPQSVDDIDHHRVRSSKVPQGWADLEW